VFHLVSINFLSVLGGYPLARVEMSRVGVLNGLRGLMDDLAIICYSKCPKKVKRYKTTRQRLCRRGHSLIVLAEGLISNMG